MDPNATLMQMLQHMAEGDRDGAMDALDVLRDWLIGGGFMPERAAHQLLDDHQTPRAPEGYTFQRTHDCIVVVADDGRFHEPYWKQGKPLRSCNTHRLWCNHREAHAWAAHLLGEEPAVIPDEGTLIRRMTAEIRAKLDEIDALTPKEP